MGTENKIELSRLTTVALIAVVLLGALITCAKEHYPEGRCNAGDLYDPYLAFESARSADELIRVLRPPVWCGTTAPAGEPSQADTFARVLQLDWFLALAVPLFLWSFLRMRDFRGVR